MNILQKSSILLILITSCISIDNPLLAGPSYYQRSVLKTKEEEKQLQKDLKKKTLDLMKEIIILKKNYIKRLEDTLINNPKEQNGIRETLKLIRSPQRRVHEVSSLPADKAFKKELKKAISAWARELQTHAIIFGKDLPLEDKILLKMETDLYILNITVDDKDEKQTELKKNKILNRAKKKLKDRLKFHTLRFQKEMKLKVKKTISSIEDNSYFIISTEEVSENTNTEKTKTELAQNITKKDQENPINSKLAKENNSIPQNIIFTINDTEDEVTLLPFETIKIKITYNFDAKEKFSSHRTSNVKFSSKSKRNNKPLTKEDLKGIRSYGSSSSSSYRSLRYRVLDQAQTTIPEAPGVYKFDFIIDTPSGQWLFPTYTVNRKLPTQEKEPYKNLVKLNLQHFFSGDNIIRYNNRNQEEPNFKGAISYLNKYPNSQYTEFIKNGAYKAFERDLYQNAKRYNESDRFKLSFIIKKVFKNEALKKCYREQDYSRGRLRKEEPAFKEHYESRLKNATNWIQLLKK